ncbi:MAG: FtsX-like permease family protein [Bacteroidales bacterium]|nr:FtsX-like permease family protein [Bacteroidales bacterium]
MITYGTHGTFTITGVFEDAPEQSHYKYNVLVDFKTAEDNFPSMSSWTSNSMTTYVEFNDKTDIASFGEKFTEYLLPYAPEDVPEEYVYRLYLQNVSDIHLHSGHIKYQYNRKMGNGVFIVILSLVGILLLVIASINYINLSIARSVKRSREVGMRKVLGATRQKLINQFLGESLIITFISIILSMVMAELLIPEFNALMNTSLQLTLSPAFLVYLLIILLVVSFISGSYPAFYLSRYNPAKVLKGDTGKGISSTTLTKILVGFQFFISTALIFFIILTNEQMNFIKSKDLGINYENVINLGLSSNSRRYSRIKAYKEALVQNSLIKGVTLTTAISGAGGSQSTITVDDTSQTSVMVRVCIIDDNFLPLMEVPVIKGRNFNGRYAMDTTSSIIINEALADFVGWKNPVGKRFNPYMSDTVPAGCWHGARLSLL